MLSRPEGPAPGNDQGPSLVRAPSSSRTIDADCFLPSEGTPMDITTLAGLLKEAEEHHGQYEATAPQHHWWDWYAAYIVSREQGSTPEQSSAEAGRHMDAVLR
jgi:hypothetical protein